MTDDQLDRVEAASGMLVTLEQEVKADEVRRTCPDGSLSNWGSGGRWFKSSHPDQYFQLLINTKCADVVSHFMV